MRTKNRDRLLEAGRALFYGQGFSATGVQEIADKAGVPKGSFYNHFRSKEQFAAAVVARYASDTVERVSHYFEDRQRPPLERLAQLFHDWSEPLDQPAGAGCLAGNLCQELALGHAEIRAALDAAFTQMQDAFRGFIAEARERGDLAAAADVDELTLFLFSSWQGALLTAKATGRRDALSAFLEVTFDRTLAQLR